MKVLMSVKINVKGSPSRVFSEYKILTELPDADLKARNQAVKAVQEDFKMRGEEIPQVAYCETSYISHVDIDDA